MQDSLRGRRSKPHNVGSKAEADHLPRKAQKLEMNGYKA